ncbi:MAG: hydrolase [Tissierellia bacterium]|nr:hydrolase [Tissierellia bacterium]
MKNFYLNKEDAVLMIVDIQGKLTVAMEYGKDVIKNTNVLVQAAKSFEFPIIITEQYPKGLGSTVEELKNELEGYPVFSKTSFTAITEEVKEELKKLGRKQIIITGMETHVCVYQTVRDLLSMGYDVFVAIDAVCSRTHDNFMNGLLLINELGAVVSNTESILFDIIKDSSSPLFKELSKLIK